VYLFKGYCKIKPMEGIKSLNFYYNKVKLPIEIDYNYLRIFERKEKL